MSQTQARRVTYHPGGDITTDEADILVNTVNCVSVMGKGVALAFKRRWPTIMPAYVEACRDGSLMPGGCVLFDLPDRPPRRPHRRWAALATKAHWRAPSAYPWIDSGLRTLATLARADGARSIALPPPGCGNGGLDWAKVEPKVLDYLSGFELHIYAATTIPGGSS
jgi:O-acetyl-ADP-ribose deacetylase (regulator of RNase III)